MFHLGSTIYPGLSPAPSPTRFGLTNTNSLSSSLTKLIVTSSFYRRPQDTAATMINQHRVHQHEDNDSSRRRERRRQSRRASLNSSRQSTNDDTCYDGSPIPKLQPSRSDVRSQSRRSSLGGSFSSLGSSYSSLEEVSQISYAVQDTYTVMGMRERRSIRRNKSTSKRRTRTQVALDASSSTLGSSAAEERISRTPRRIRRTATADLPPRKEQNGSIRRLRTAPTETRSRRRRGSMTSGVNASIGEQHRSPHRRTRTVLETKDTAELITRLGKTLGELSVTRISAPINCQSPTAA